MKVCAHINYGPFTNGNDRFDSVKDAIAHFRHEVLNSHYRHGTTDESDGCYVMDLYPQCDDCRPMENYHDYPMSRYSVGVRGGLRKEAI